jgi:hypothetical protein
MAPPAEVLSNTTANEPMHAQGVRQDQVHDSGYCSSPTLLKPFDFAIIFVLLNVHGGGFESG